jgi:cytochrome c-type biogenesis protein CcmF|tara:strand:- start:1586 stop:3460 length:1875 start_codon:yes stop_codon:yes gene_type:complete
LFFSQLGFYSLIIGLVFSIILFPVAYRDLFTDSNSISSNIFSISFLKLFFVLLSFICLIISFINSDFSNEIVYNNSHTTKPLLYKISGTWGNHEGSFLLCLLILVFFIFIFLITSRKEPKKYRIITLLFQEIIIIGFFLFLLITSNPFNHLFPIPKEGLGLNPILQDPILVIHPPILYLGYIGSSIILSSSIAAIIQNQVNSEWAKNLKIWVIISWIFLTIGIVLGSIWAYYELGWGGFWFWDPVENISLMPWLCLTALVHSVIVLEKRSLFATWTLILSISSFTLSMCGTFLVRSGILNSVHTFANDPSRGIFILFFLFFLILISLIIFFFFYKEKKIKQKNFLFSKETSILINNWFMMYFLSVVLIGTVYPIFLEVITNEKISVGAPFYSKLLIPFLIPFLFLMSIGPKMKWIRQNVKLFNVKLILLFFLSIFLSCLILFKTELDTLFVSVLVIFSVYLFFVTIRDFFINNQINFSQKISHFGFSLLILSIIMNGIFSREVITNIGVGEKYEFNNGTIYFENINTSEKKNYTSIVGIFRIKENNNNEIYLEPELRIFNQPLIVTSEADIKTNFIADKFLVMNFVKGNDYYNIKYQTKPFMIWIWLSAVLMCVGALINFFKRR